MKNGNNSVGKRALEYHCFLLVQIIYPTLKKCVARRHGKMDQLFACVTGVIIRQLKELVFSI